MTGLKAERLKRGLPQRVVAAKAGLDQTTYSRIENGILRPYPGWKKRIAEALDMPEDALFQEVETDGQGNKLG